MSVLVTEQDFYDLAWAYLERAHADNVRHVEMFFDPQGHTSRGIAFATVIEGLHRAIVDAGEKLGVQASLIMTPILPTEISRNATKCCTSASESANRTGCPSAVAASTSSALLSGAGPPCA